jgi:sec-independent protein translocase protein TatA
MNPQPTFAFFQNLQGWELLLIFFVILLLFGGKRLPELARGLGKSVREFRRATHEAEETFREAMDVSKPLASSEKQEEAKPAEKQPLA